MISIIIPIYNEEENIIKTYDFIESALEKLNYEVIFVNDGSTDKSENKIREIIKKSKKYKLISLRRNYGQTAAMQAGFDHAIGEIIIPMDGDLQNDPNDIPKLLNKIDEGYDVVSGWRKNRSDKYCYY